MYTNTIKKIIPLKEPSGKVRAYLSRVYRVLVKASHKYFTLAEKYSKITTNSFNAHYPQIKKITIRIIVGALIVDSVLFVYLYKRVFTPISVAEASLIQEYYGPFMPRTGLPLDQIETGVMTTELLGALTKAKFTPKFVGGLEKSQDMAVRNIIILGNDNISVYEYADSQTATTEATLYVEKYVKDPDKYVREEYTHIYVKDTLMIIYVGTDEKILKSLTDFAGKSLVG